MRRLKWDNGKARSPKSGSGEASQHHQRLVLTEGWLRRCLAIFTGSKGAGAQNGQPSHRETGPPQHEAAYGPASPRGRSEHWAQGTLAEGRETLPITKLKLSQASPSVGGRAADVWRGLWGTPEQSRGPQVPVEVEVRPQLLGW